MEENIQISPQKTTTPLQPAFNQAEDLAIPKKHKTKIVIATIVSVVIIVVIIIIGLFFLNNNKLNDKFFLDYLHKKYGQTTEFEILSIDQENIDITGDGYVMGTDPEPIVISSEIRTEAKAIEKSTWTSFSVVHWQNKTTNKTRIDDDLCEKIIDQSKNNFRCR